MKISQREKSMLVFLCILLVGALLYLQVLSPKLDERSEAQDKLTLIKTEWGEIIDPVYEQFVVDTLADDVWRLSGSALDNRLNNLIFERNYKLGNDITDLMGEASDIGSSSIIPNQPLHDMYGFIHEEYLESYIEYLNFSITSVTITEFAGEESNVYRIASSRITITEFSTVGNDIDNFYEMLEKMESSDYIVVENWSYNPMLSTNNGNITIQVLMTPGDLSHYDVVTCTECGRYNHSDANECKYCNESLSEVE